MAWPKCASAALIALKTARVAPHTPNICRVLLMRAGTAGEVLLAMYERVQEVAAMRALPMLADVVFGIPVGEVVQCRACGRVTQQAAYMQYLLTVQVGSVPTGANGWVQECWVVFHQMCAGWLWKMSGSAARQSTGNTWSLDFCTLVEPPHTGLRR